MTAYRNQHEVSVVHFVSGTDAYGQIRQLGSTLTITEMDIKVRNQSNTDNPVYIDSTHIGLSKDTTLTTEEQIIDGSDTYNIMYKVPSSRYYVYFLKKQ